MRLRNSGNEDEPAVIQLMAHILEVVVAHVIDAEDEAVLVLGYSLANVGKKLVLCLATLLVHLGEVVDAGTFGFGHCGGFELPFALKLLFLMRINVNWM